jgi:hypothetical protein
VKLKAVWPDGDAPVGHGVKQLKQLFFPLRRVAGLDIGDEHVEPRRGKAAERERAPLEALAGFVGRDLLVVVGVEESKDKHAPAAGSVGKAGELDGDGGFCLEGRERPRHLRPPEHSPRRKPECGCDPHERIAVEFHGAVDHRKRLPCRAAQRKADGVHAGMPVEQTEASRGLREAGEGPLESRQEGQSFGIDAANVHVEAVTVMAVVHHHDTTNLSYCQESDVKNVVIATQALPVAARGVKCSGICCVGGKFFVYFCTAAKRRNFVDFSFVSRSP